jgi:DNA-binding IclR family transcriptional regulator
MSSGKLENMAPGPRKGVEAVDRALSVLGSFSEHDNTLSLTEISSRSGLYPSTVLRLMESMERGGYIVRLADKRFALGPELMRLGSLYRRRFRLEHVVRPVLQRLSDATGESASYFRQEGSRRLCLFRVNSRHSIRDHIEEGDLLALDKGAAGHVLIQFGSPGADVPALFTQLPFVSYGERDSETAAAAVPVFSADGGIVGALAVSGLITRFTPDKLKTIADALLQNGSALSTALGGRQYLDQASPAGAAGA